MHIKIHAPERFLSSSERAKLEQAAREVLSRLGGISRALIKLDGGLARPGQSAHVCLIGVRLYQGEVAVSTGEAPDLMGAFRLALSRIEPSLAAALSRHEATT